MGATETKTARGAVWAPSPPGHSRRGRLVELPSSARGKPGLSAWCRGLCRPDAAPDTVRTGSWTSVQAGRSAVQGASPTFHVVGRGG